jgi:3-oxoacyl-[acyl-carrier protein] reductase
MTADNLCGRTALVTGGSRGIGAAISKALAEAGAAVAINYKERDDAAKQLADILRKTGVHAITVQADVSQTDAVAKMVQIVKSELGAIDILINNAGIAITRGIDDLSEADFDRTISVNLKSVFLCTQAICDDASQKMGAHRQHFLGRRSRSWFHRTTLQRIQSRH